MTSFRPLVPEDFDQRGQGTRALVKAVHKQARAAFEQRAAPPPLTLSTVAGVIAPLVVDYLATLTAQSAAAALFETGLQLSFGGAPSISIPALAVPAAANVGWIAETQPIPVRQLNSVGGPVLSPRKLAVLTVLSEEMLSSSNAEALIRDALTASSALALDAAVFDAAAGDTTRPAGLRNGIAALTAGTMDADVAALIGAVAPVAGAQPVVLITDPAHAAKLHLRSGGFPAAFPVLVSGAASVAGILIAVASAALVSVSGDIRIESSKDALLHMADPASQISTGGGMAAPVASLWQSGNVSIRLLMDQTWCLRDNRGVAWVTPTW